MACCYTTMMKIPLVQFIVLLGALWLPAGGVAGEIVSPEFREQAQTLTKARFSQIGSILQQLEAADPDAALPLFQVMLAGDLYYLKSNRLLVVAIKTDSGTYRLSDPWTGADLGEQKSRPKRLRINNSVRSHLRGAIARLTLASQKPEVRLSAVNEMIGEPDPDNTPLLQQALAKESDAKVREAIELALAINVFSSSEQREQRLEAVRKMQGSLEPAVRNLLTRATAIDDDGTPLEGDEVVVAAAKEALANIESRISFYRLLEKLFFGVSLGSVLLLAATGLAITFGVMGVINMAHGELIMLGAYTTYVVQLLMPNHIGLSVLVAIPAAFLVAGSVGILIERSVIRFLHGRPLETLLATFGISLLLQQTVRTIFSPLNRAVETPAWMSGSLEINSVLSLTYNRLYIVIFALVVFFALQFVLKKTSLGLHVRAVSQNRAMAKAIGIRTDRVDAMTFGLGCGIAGIAGVALSQLTNVGPNLGQAYIIDSFLVVVFGGVGNLWGTLVGGLTLGVANKFLEPVTGAVLAKILILIFIILFIQKRPSGLFPQRGRAAE